MSSDFLLGIDIGTYESKGTIADRVGNVVAQAAVPHDVSMPRPGWAEHDADGVWWNDFCHLCHVLFERSGLCGDDIAAVGCSTIAACVLPVNKRGQPLRPGILYGIDTRATAQIRALEGEVGADTIFQVCGNALSAQSAGPKIRWLRDAEPDVFRQAHKFLTGSSYLVYRLTGTYVVDFYTSWSFGPLLNVKELRWDPDMCGVVVEESRLPRLAWTTEVAGAVTPSAAQETGLAVGTPVIVGTADASAEAVSVGVMAPGQLMLMYGSTMFFIQVTESLLVDERLWAGVYLFPGTYALVAGMATSGSITRWFRDNFAHAETAEEQSTGRSAYAQLADSVVAIPEGAGGLIVLPYFAGERTPLNDPLARGVIAGLTLAHTRSHVYRAILEGTAYGAKHNLDVMRELGRTPEDVIAVGGGTRNRAWVQIVSDVTGLPQRIPAESIGASYGDAFLAGCGIGVIEDSSDIDAWVKTVDRVEPRAEAHETYQEYYALYRELYESSKDQIHALAHLGDMSLNG